MSIFAFGQAKNSLYDYYTKKTASHSSVLGIITQQVKLDTELGTTTTLKVQSFMKDYVTDMLSRFFKPLERIDQETTTTLKLAHSNEIIVTPRINNINIETLKSDIMNILGEDPQNYGVYLYDFTREQELGINEDFIFPPGSISKVPVAIMTLREVDKGNIALDQYFEFTWDSWADPSNALKSYHVGASFTINEYLRFLIIDSDNSSIRKLENILGGHEVLNEKVKTELGVEHFFRDPHDVTAKDMGKVFRGIHDGTYLKKETNDYLIDLLFNTHFSLQDGIPVGLPAGISIAHKTGQIPTYPGFSWNDAGIIYGEKTDYVLVFVNQFIANEDARYKIQEISRIVYERLN